MICTLISKHVAAGQPGERYTSSDDPATSDRCLTGRSLHCKVYDKALPIFILIGRDCFLHGSGRQERVPQFLVMSYFVLILRRAEVILTLSDVFL
jgi:hypothetical protein